MKRRSLTWSAFFLWSFIFAAFTCPVQAQTEQVPPEQSVMVGRIAHVEGTLLRYVPDEQDWVAVVKDAPFGLYDALYSEEGGRAEFIMPNETWVRIGGDTQIQLITVDSGVTEIDVASGTARFYNKSGDAVIKATTPFGYVTAPPNTSFDMYVGNDSVEVIALEGRVDFVHGSQQDTRYEVTAGSYAILADSRQVTSTEMYVDANWDGWNRERDALWSKRTQVAGDSVEYLPPELQHDAYALDEYGRWENVYYDGANRYFWRPVRVAAGWAPFTMGRWTVWYGDNCWIPTEPFGFITHHYGSWVFVGGLWYWAPPVVRAGARFGRPLPLLPIPFAWYPGRVAWMYSGVRVGWIPLAPFETFYARRPWGPRVVVVHNVAAVNLNLRSFRYLDHAVIVNQSNFYRANTYRNVRITGISNVTIIKDFRPAPVISGAVIHNYNSIPQRFDFTNVRVARKPHQTTVARIRHNQAISQKNTNVTAHSIRVNVGKAKLSAPARGAQIAPPKVSAKLVPANQVNKPVNKIKFPEKQVKGKTQPVVPKKQPMPKPVPTGPPGGMKQAPKPSQQPAPAGSHQQMKPQPPAQGKQAAPYGQPRQTSPVQGKQGAPVQQQSAPQYKPKTGPAPIGQQGPPAQSGMKKQPVQPPQQQFQPGYHPQGQPPQPAKKVQKPAQGHQVQPLPQPPKSAPAGQSGHAKQGGHKKAKSQAELEAEQKAKQGSYGPQGQPGLQKPPGQPPRQQGAPGWPQPK